MPEQVDIHPLDKYNETLIANVHPEDWINPEPKGRYNLVVIGAGTAGLVTALGAAGLGARVAIVERHLLGGDCLNYGCVPSKSLIRASRVYSAVMRAGNYGVRVPSGTTVDFAVFMERMRRLRAAISKSDFAMRVKGRGIDVFIGAGRIGREVYRDVSEQQVEFRVSVATPLTVGLSTVIQGLEESGYLTNETLFSLTELPSRMAVVGAGPIGCEMAQAFQRFGSRVVLLEKTGQILPREDAEAGERLKMAFLSDGIDVRLNTEVAEVLVRDGKKVVCFIQGEEKKEVAVDAILVGIGRAPNGEDLDLDKAGVEFGEREGVRVDDRLRTTNPGIFAAGDICSRYKFTHSADAMARIVIRNALFGGRTKVSALTIPWSTYTDPEIAHVGLSESEIDRENIPVDTYVQEFNEVDRAVLDGEDEGYVKVHAKKGTDKILGATVVASHAGDLISEITLAMVGGLGLKTISGTIHPYPTQGEAIKKVGDAYFRSRMSPSLGKLFSLWFKLRR